MEKNRTFRYFKRPNHLASYLRLYGRVGNTRRSKPYIQMLNKALMNRMEKSRSINIQEQSSIGEKDEKMQRIDNIKVT